jgi:phage gpG-like protein
MQVSINLRSDGITPAMQKQLAVIQNRQPILEAGALQMLSWAQAAFEDPTKRPTPWPARKSGSNPLLKKSRALQQSLRVVKVTNDSASVGTDRVYAAFHQFGTRPYVIRPTKKKYLFWAGAKHPVKKVNHPGLPPRPFFPITSGGWMAAAKERILRTMGDAINAELGIE